jgi:SAM-dependent methyltransferase
METFSADWLALREPADHAARAHELVTALAAHLRTRPPGRVLDLAGGTGSNIRYLLPRLPGIARWTLFDHDPRLLEVATRDLEPRCTSAGSAFDTVRGDLNDVARLPLDEGALVTASALLDLVSAAWLRAFARRCRETRVSVLCALSYDGVMAGDPPEPEDERVRTLVNAHQRTDKGFGPALGPDAAVVAEQCFREEGYEVRIAPSDWHLGPELAPLQRPLIEGWAGAAKALAPAEAEAIDVWQARRIALVGAGVSRLRVGHRDLLAWPVA